MGKYSQVVLTTPFGKYLWWPPLQIVQFVPKGKRNAQWEGYLQENKSNLVGAIRKACRHAVEMGDPDAR